MSFLGNLNPWKRKRDARPADEAPLQKRRLSTPSPDRRFSKDSLIDFSYNDDYDSQRKLVPVIRRSEAADAQLQGDFQKSVEEAKSEVFRDTEIGVDNPAVSDQFHFGGATNARDFLDLTGDEDNTQLPSQMMSTDDLPDMDLGFGMLDDVAAYPNSEEGSPVAQQEEQEAEKNGETVVHSEDIHGEEEAPDNGTLFSNFFGDMQPKGDDEDDDNDSVISIEDSDDNRKYRRPSTPPRPTAIKPQDLNKDVFPTAADRKEKARLRKIATEDYPGPCIVRDRSDLLNAYWRSHEHAWKLVPTLANYETLDWTRRYWVAVLLEDKTPSLKNGVMDFVWMRANKFTSVATVFHAYLNTSFTDKEELTLLFMGRETNMKWEMRSLDMFSHKFVVMRAVNKGSKPAEDAKTRSLVPGIEPPPVIDLIDDD